MLQPGAVLQTRYAIDSLIGAGGMGRVYLSRQTMLKGRRLAIKEIAFDTVPESERTAAMEAFRREAETLAGLSHPNLVDVKDCFEEEGKVYLVMDFIDGETLEDLVSRQGPLPVETVLEYARQLCTVLTYLHSCDPPVIFRDLKPSNVMLDQAGVVRLVDFGLAQVQDGRSRARRTEGTPGYAPVEQMLDIEIPCDRRSDIYGLGATIYHLVSGRTPIDACARLVDDALQAPADMAIDIPAWLSDGIMRMMALRPDDRYETVLEVRDMLDGHQRTRPTYLAPVLPALFERITAATHPVLEPEAFLRDLLGRRHDVTVLDFENDRLQFTCSQRFRIAPREVYFVVRGHEAPVRVACRVVDTGYEADRVTVEVQLFNIPLAVHRVLRDCFKRTLRVEARQPRQTSRRGVSLHVWIHHLELDAWAADLSLSGCRLVTADPLPLGRRLSCCIVLDDLVLPDIEVEGEVRWSRAHGDGFESGVAFTVVDPRTRDALRLYLEQPVLLTA